MYNSFVMNHLDSTEKRKYARISIQSRILACVENPNDAKRGKEFFALGKNIGAEGIQFISETKLEAGSKLSMKIDFPDDQDSLTIEGEVRWCRRVKKLGEHPEFYDTGVRFLKIDRDHLRMLIKYVCGNLTEDIFRDIDK